MAKWEVEEEMVKGEMTITDADGQAVKMPVDTYLWTFDKRSVYEKLADIDNTEESDVPPAE